ncbi:hypothetical protein OCU04_002801 [Sclerotinia nivalis]|uniref:Uncharacterized protein n=1 Tax=Sclerotinia nivalis TaxID=352851 RepID=A0A9X0AUD7_9HELO|nr:hypothetical protein OCU04_002801 [Sclerotinia nivalis]
MISFCPYSSSQSSSLEEFATVVTNDIAIWYHYLISLYDYNIRVEAEVTDLQSAVQKLILDLQVEKTVFIRWKEENDGLIVHLIQFHSVPVALPISTDSSPLIPVTIPVAASVLSKSQLSEKVSNPVLFDKTKIDLDRFVDQI